LPFCHRFRGRGEAAQVEGYVFLADNDASFALAYIACQNPL